jgi:hypothetical protein
MRLLKNNNGAVMSVNPLDLQVSFSQMGNVGKQQSNVKETDEVKQSAASQILNKEGVKESDEVPETKDVNEGPGKIKDKQEKSDEKNKSKGDKLKTKGSEEEAEEEKDEKLKDPNLGQRIDILG